MPETKKFDFKKNIVLGFPENIHQAEALAKILDIPCAGIDIHYFPDGEAKMTLPANLLKSADQAILYRSLNYPNTKLVELVIAAQGCRDAGIDVLTLVAPYLCYMRQDIAFNPGEVVSQQVIGKLLAGYFDNVYSVDAHLHRIEKLSEAIPCKRAKNLNATVPMADFLKQQYEYPFLLGPDEESEQWVGAIANLCQFEYAVATKKRLGDREVVITLPNKNYHNRDIVLLDDMASSGKTLIETVHKLSAYKPSSISVLVTHALFMDDSIKELQAAGVTNIWSTNSVSHASNVISLADLFAVSLMSD